MNQYQPWSGQIDMIFWRSNYALSKRNEGLDGDLPVSELMAVTELVPSWVKEVVGSYEGDALAQEQLAKLKENPKILN